MKASTLRKVDLIDKRLRFIEITWALDVLANATQHLARQFRGSMTRAEAKAHFDARIVLLRVRFRVLDEGETELFGTVMPGATRQ